MAKSYVVYGQKGTGSVPVEATLLLLGERYEMVERADWDQGTATSRVVDISKPSLVGGTHGQTDHEPRRCRVRRHRRERPLHFESRSNQ
jgi:hypothetical protein